MVCLVENVVIGCDSVVGAGPVATHNVASRSTVVGVPARQINKCL